MRKEDYVLRFLLGEIAVCLLLVALLAIFALGFFSVGLLLRRAARVAYARWVNHSPAASSPGSSKAEDASFGPNTLKAPSL